MPFKFPATMDSLDSVPDEFKSLYVPTDDEKFQLVDDLKAVISQGGALTAAVDTERKRAQGLEKQLKAWKAIGETPEAVQAKLQEADEKHATEVADLRKLIDENGDASSKFEKLKQDMEKNHAKLIADKDAELEEMQDALEKHLIEAAAISAINEEKGRVKPLLPTITSKLKLQKENGDYVVRVVDSDGDPRGDGKGGYLDIKGLVAELKEDQDYAPLFEASGITGSGSTGRQAGGGTGGVPPGMKNPWAQATRNITEQMRLQKENPKLAEKLRAAATT